MIPGENFFGKIVFPHRGMVVQPEARIRHSGAEIAEPYRDCRNFCPSRFDTDSAGITCWVPTG